MARKLVTKGKKVSERKKRVQWLSDIPAKQGVAWGYFSKSGKSLEIYARAGQRENAGAPTIIVRLTLKQFLSGGAQ
jgi:hypothetical protein